MSDQKKENLGFVIEELLLQVIDLLGPVFYKCNKSFFLLFQRHLAFILSLIVLLHFNFGLLQGDRIHLLFIVFLWKMEKTNPTSCQCISNLLCQQLNNAERGDSIFYAMLRRQLEIFQKLCCCFFFFFSNSSANLCDIFSSPSISLLQCITYGWRLFFNRLCILLL